MTTKPVTIESRLARVRELLAELAVRNCPKCIGTGLGEAGWPCVRCLGGKLIPDPRFDGLRRVFALTPCWSLADVPGALAGAIERAVDDIAEAMGKAVYEVDFGPKAENEWGLLCAAFMGCPDDSAVLEALVEWLEAMK